MTIRKFKSERELQDHIKDHPTKYYILDFWADWCNPCKKIAPEFESLSNVEEYRDIYFVKVDVEDEAFKNIVNALDVKSLPTFVVIGCSPNGGFHILCRDKGASRSTIEGLLQHTLKHKAKIASNPE